MGTSNKTTKNKSEEHKFKDTESFEKIKRSHPYFSKDSSFYEEMEWFLSGNFINIRKDKQRIKASSEMLQPC
jgi:hypothetical protein